MTQLKSRVVARVTVGKSGGPVYLSPVLKMDIRPPVAIPVARLGQERHLASGIFNMLG
jgi:hypothetical protein